MSNELLQRVSSHISHLLTGYTLRYFRWTDSDLRGSGQVVLFRMAGTSGPSDHQIQYPDVSVQMICNPDSVVAGDAVMLSVLRFLRSEAGFTSATIENFEPLRLTGPAYLENGRARFELVIRCLVEDH
mgnify:CR=1 FL=1